MPSLGDYLNKPEYLFRPAQVVRRLARAWGDPGGTAEVGLPWGLALGVRLSDDVGRALWTTGVYDLAVSETLWRLLDPGETAVDAGANIGYMTALMTARAGAAGTVWAFEPHPALFAELQANRRCWTAAAGAAVRCERAALSDREGHGFLVEGPAFSANRGTAHVGSDASPAPPSGAARSAGDGAARLPVRLTSLDAALPPGTSVGVLKLDVEGHEAAVLRGAERLLAARAVRDVVYEEHQPGSEASAVLRAHGYEVFDVRKRLLGPTLEPAGRTRAPEWMPPSRLATANAARARARLAPRGWRCLRGR